MNFEGRARRSHFATGRNTFRRLVPSPDRATRSTHTHQPTHRPTSSNLCKHQRTGESHERQALQQAKSLISLSCPSNILYIGKPTVDLQGRYLRLSARVSIAQTNAQTTTKMNPDLQELQQHELMDFWKEPWTASTWGTWSSQGPALQGLEPSSSSWMYTSESQCTYKHGQLSVVLAVLVVPRTLQTKYDSAMS